MKLSNAALAMLFVITSAHAQMYKWVNPDGSISYSDAPPPSTATKVEKKSYSGAGPSLTDLPYELAQAVKGNPVTLYTMKNCPACDAGRQLLTSRGVPFSEKTVSTNEDNEKLRQVSGSTSLPVLIVGRNKQVGFESGQWGGMLTAANYPTSNTLPKTYSNPAPEPAAPEASKTAEAPKKPQETELKGIVQPPPAAGNAPPGFQF